MKKRVKVERPCNAACRRRYRQRTLLRPLLPQLSSQLLSEFYQRRFLKRDHSNEPISHEIDFSDKYGTDESLKGQFHISTLLFKIHNYI